MAAITPLLSSDTGPTSRGVINTNFTNINNELTTASSDIDAAQTDISALETDKLNKNAELRTGNGAWKVVYNNGSGNETELALGAADTFLKSNGETSAPSFGNPSIDINGQTEDTTGDMDADFALVYDTSAGANRKQKVNVYRASDAEALAGTVTNKFITPKQAKDNYGLAFNFLASDNLRASADTTRAMGSETSYTKFKEIQLPTNSGTGTIRVKFLRTYTSGNALQTTVYVNGVAVPATAESSTTTATRSYDISASPGDLIQLYAFQASGAGDGSVANFRVYYDNTPKSPSNGTTILD